MIGSKLFSSSRIAKVTGCGIRGMKRVRSNIRVLALYTHLGMAVDALYPSLLKSIEQRFNERLETHIMRSIRSLLVKRKKMVYPEPNESTLFSLPASMSTLHSAEPLEVVVERENSVRTQPLIVSSPKSQASSSGAATTTKNLIAITPTETSNPRQMSSKCKVHETGELTQGHARSESIQSGSTSRFHRAGPLEIQIEYWARPNSDPVVSKGTPNNLAYSVKWLTGVEADMLYNHKPTSIINGESLHGESSYKLDELICIYVGARGSVLQIMLPSNGDQGNP
jgi:hypothetical protein